MNQLTDLLAAIAAEADPFADTAVLEAMIRVEVALARAQAHLGLIPRTAAEAIAQAGDAMGFDPPTLAAGTAASATPVIPFVRALLERTRAIDPAAAGFVHWGATSQDVADTALVLCLRQAHDQLATGYTRLATGLRDLSDRHAGTVMLGRTLLQPGPPTTFGLKVAGWYGACARGWTRIEEAGRAGHVLQFGGAVGTLAALGDDGPRVAEALGVELQLRVPDAPWHSQRDRVVSMMAACGVYVGTLGKIARDISLLMQAEIGEVAEPGGGSSTMPHKQNPSGCAVVLSAATRVPGLVGTMLSAMPQEHERGVGGLQAEWPTVAAIVRASRAAQDVLADVVSGLEVDEARMRRNLEATGGSVFAEPVMLRLARHLGRDVAYDLVGAAVRQSRRSGRSFLDVLAETPEVGAHLSADDLAALMRPERYLGSAELLRRRLLAAEQPV